MTAATIIVEPLVTLDAHTDQKALLDGLKFVSAALPTRAPMRVLLGIRISAGLGITLAAFDYEMSVTETVVGTGNGTVLVPGKLLGDVVKALDPGPLRLAALDGKLIVTQGDVRFAVPLLPLEDYPELPGTVGDTFATMTGADLVQLNRASAAVSTDNTLPILTGIRLECDGGTLTSAATDRYRLAVVRTAIPAADMAAAVVPHQALAFLAKHFARQDVVTLLTGKRGPGGEGTLIAVSGNRTVTTRLLEGAFPKYRSLLPAEDAFTASAIVDVAGFVKAVKQVTVAAAGHQPVRLHCSAEGIRLETGNNDDASASKWLRESFTGDSLVIAYNPAYLMDGLNAQGKKQARFRFVGATRPGIIDSPEDPAFTYLLMPIRLSG